MIAKHSQSVAIIGAGIAGAVLARELRDVANITLFDKARGVSGRLATRYHNDFSFDHGAPFFTARSASFKRFIKPWVDAGHLVDWQPKTTTLQPNGKAYTRQWFEPHYVAPKKMNQWCKALIGDLNVQLGVEITAFDYLNNQWLLTSKSGDQYGAFDWVISTAPSHQAASWLPSNCAFLEAVSAAQMTPAYSLMLGFKGSVKAPNWDIAKCLNSSLNWVLVENSKPGHLSLADSNSLSLTLHADSQWAKNALDEDDETVISKMLGALYELYGDLTQLGTLEYQSLHRWRYASVALDRPDSADMAAHGDAACAPKPFFVDREKGLAAAGDWCLYGDVDSAFNSAHILATYLLGSSLDREKR